ncbi:solute carrier family 35 member G1-like protein [Leptotrombidium deliense]|uniref:Solute carrier family 35 member G1-like protein n=1 Tax=Leptotrombidium deliense TaxID=299467 RepID=A0A443SCI5_9ACAR|nr:solute carrier family 35 member G1-like protein [Leptotrombidium deliense]
MSEELSFSKKLKSIPLIGIIFALLSALFIATETLCVKLISNIDAVELIVLRSLFATIAYALFLLYKRHSIFAAAGEHLILFTRCVLGFIGVICGFFAIRTIPLGDASAIIYSTPVLVTLFAKIILKEKCSIVNCVAIVIAVIGVVLISRPSFLFESEDSVQEKNRLIGTALATGCCIFSALVFICIRKLQKTPSPLVIFYYSLTAVLCGSIMVLIFGKITIPTDYKTYLFILLMGFCGTFGQLFMTLAFKLEEAGPVSLARSLSMVIAFIYQITILNEKIMYTSIAGAGIVFVAIVIVALRKWYESNPEAFKQIICFANKSPQKDMVSQGVRKDCEVAVIQS